LFQIYIASLTGVFQQVVKLKFFGRKGRFLYFFVRDMTDYFIVVFHQRQFKSGLELRFRAIRPSDEEEMRRLFYRFSEESVYYRYFTPITAMPHNKMQEYVNIDYSRTMSIVALEGDAGKGKIIAEARYVKLQVRPYAEVAFIVDEDYQGQGIASYLLQMLIRIARENRITGFVASVNVSNGAMIRVFEKSGLTIETRIEDGTFSVTIPFS